MCEQRGLRWLSRDALVDRRLPRLILSRSPRRVMMIAGAVDVDHLPFNGVWPMPSSAIEAAPDKPGRRDCALADTVSSRRVQALHHRIPGDGTGARGIRCSGPGPHDCRRRAPVPIGEQQPIYNVRITARCRQDNGARAVMPPTITPPGRYCRYHGVLSALAQCFE